MTPSKLQTPNLSLENAAQRGVRGGSRSKFGREGYVEICLSAANSRDLGKADAKIILQNSVKRHLFSNFLNNSLRSGNKFSRIRLQNFLLQILENVGRRHKKMPLICTLSRKWENAHFCTSQHILENPPHIQKNASHLPILEKVGKTHLCAS